MIKHSLTMSCRGYFLVKNYLVKLRQQGEFDKDTHMMKFYKSFAMESSIKLYRNISNFNENATVMFELDDNRTLLTTIGLFCSEHSLDQKTIDTDLADALFALKNYIASQLEGFLGL